MQFLRNLFSSLKEYLFIKGWIRKDVNVYQAISMIVGTTIGAGILGIPYAVSKVGLLFGIILILLLGFLVIGLNLLVGEVSARTNGSLQLVGLVKKYLGAKMGVLMTFIFYIQLFIILTVYIIGMGSIASEFFWGGPLFWGIIVWFMGAMIVFRGIDAIKTAELILTAIIFVAILTISFLAMPHVQIEFVKYSNWTAFLVPYGVVLFALSGVGTIPAAYRLLQGKNEDFKFAIITATSIAMIIYIVFTFLVVGVLGSETTEIATLGLGQALGRPMFYVANAFAFLAMMTSFIMLGMQLRDSMEWDFHFPYLRASAIALLVPLVIFLMGLRQFIFAINIVGGVFYSVKMFLLVLVYWKAKQSGEMDPVKYNLHHAVLISAFVLIAFSLGAVYSLYGMLW